MQFGIVVVIKRTLEERAAPEDEGAQHRLELVQLLEHIVVRINRKF